VWLRERIHVSRPGVQQTPQRFISEGFALFADEPAATDVRRGRVVALQARSGARRNRTDGGRAGRPKAGRLAWKAANGSTPAATSNWASSPLKTGNKAAAGEDLRSAIASATATMILRRPKKARRLLK